MHRPLILIVDDESKIRRLLAQNLELEGFDVQTFAFITARTFLLVSLA